MVSLLLSISHTRPSPKAWALYFHLRGDLIKYPRGSEHTPCHWPGRTLTLYLCLLAETEKVSEADMLCLVLFLLGYFSISHLIGLPIERSFSLSGDSARDSRYQYEHPLMGDSRRQYPAGAFLCLLP